MKNLLLLCITILTLNMNAQDPWVQMNDFPVNNFLDSGFVVNDTAYVIEKISGGILRIYEYDFINDSWDMKSDFPVPVGKSFTTFAIMDQGYLMYDDPMNPFDTVLLWKYDAINDSWEQKTNAFISGGFGFYGFTGAAVTIGNKGYLLSSGGALDSFQAYDPVLDSWAVMAEYPGVNAEKGKASYTIGDKGYFVYDQNGGGYYTPDHYAYDANTNTWEQLADIPDWSSFSICSSTFVIDNLAYVGMNYDHGVGIFWRYFPENDEWERIENCGYWGGGAFGFSSGGYGYVGGGGYQDGANNILVDEVWRLDPEYLASNDIEVTTILVYPNPVIDRLYIANHFEVSNYMIYDLSGKLVAVGTTEDNTIDVTSFSSGVYLLKISTLESVQNFKILKM